ncbi:putative alcohol dehydrogenase [Gordonia araii NBRC 100433]|uniref:Putative alcohol dehydrogenase n=1 Tax=Gordonia araii NBRC 100433 TaxID=1073574 RepID=G7H2L6_9ACTN|nr:SDR family NAD(P)-dependent oxidoreductase [Gordonia araii]NNG97747.1 SDR family NAD(P)-dependent oxidoreductase [Gordonia araii NBRC 100433]GAB10091.1 putative alcohol dehydrogenase [Gordonia araii NBRC 100433]
MKSFEGKVAVVTGAGSGIGRALAENLAGRGAVLALSDVDESGVAETVARCEKAGAKAVGYRLDVADRDAVYAHADEVIAEFGKVNVVVNNAGVSLSATVEDMSWDDFEWLMNIDFWGVAYGTKAFLPHLIASGDGHIANVSSVFGLMGIPSQSAYNAAKFAVRGFTESLRQEMIIAGHNVGVTCVHPGGIKTNIVVNGRGAGATDEEVAEAGRQFDKIAMTSAEGAAKAIVRGIRRNAPRVLIGADARFFDAVPRVIGPRYEDIAGRLAKLSGAADKLP